MSNATAIRDHVMTDGLFVIASAPAGWYEIGEGTRRWFDGRAWTDHFAPVLTLVADSAPVRTHFRTEHGFHVIMVVMTLGGWAPIWLTATICNIIRSTVPTQSYAHAHA